MVIGHSVEHRWHPDVRVVKLHHSKHDGLIQEKLPGIDTEQYDERYPKRGREDDLAHVKTPGRGHVHTCVRMVHSVESPQEWNAVIHPMP